MSKTQDTELSLAKVPSLRKCTYPNCPNEPEFLVRKNLHLCKEHYDLWKFIDYLLFDSEITINLRKSRFEVGV